MARMAPIGVMLTCLIIWMAYP